MLIHLKHYTKQQLKLEQSKEKCLNLMTCKCYSRLKYLIGRDLEYIEGILCSLYDIQSIYEDYLHIINCHFSHMHFNQSRRLCEEKKDDDALEELMNRVTFLFLNIDETLMNTKRPPKKGYSEYFGTTEDTDWYNSGKKSQDLIDSMGSFQFQNEFGFEGNKCQQLCHESVAYFDNIKQEVLHNKYICMGIDAWNQTVRKSKAFKESFASGYVRTKTESRYEDQFCNKIVEWKKGESIQLPEIITLKLYTDFDKLQFELKKCFRFVKLQKEEDLLERRKIFYHWGLQLRILMAKFSTQLAYTKNFGRLYHGVNSRLKLSRTPISVCCGPLSTTSSYHVANTFATQKGFVIEFTYREGSHNYFRGYNCALTSDYPEEQEVMLSLGYIKILKIHTRPISLDTSLYSGETSFATYLKLILFVIHVVINDVFTFIQPLEDIAIQMFRYSVKWCCNNNQDETRRDLLFFLCTKGHNSNNYESKRNQIEYLKENEKMYINASNKQELEKFIEHVHYGWKTVFEEWRLNKKSLVIRRMSEKFKRLFERNDAFYYFPKLEKVTIKQRFENKRKTTVIKINDKGQKITNVTLK